MKPKRFPKPKRWTWKEVCKAWKMKRAGRSNREIGLVLGRTGASVHYMIGKTYDM